MVTMVITIGHINGSFCVFVQDFDEERLNVHLDNASRVKKAKYG